MITIKNKIKDLAETQKELKNQRRTERLVGKRKMEPWEATMRHMTNREKLRILYAAYGLLRGKTFHEVENHYPQENHPLYQFESSINDIVKEYKKFFVRADEQAA